MNKYGVADKDRRTYKGILYHSCKEALFAERLDIMKSADDPAKRVDEWTGQVSFPLIVNGVKVCGFDVDFAVLYADGRRELIEVKGMWTREAKIKLKLFRALYPDLTLRVSCDGKMPRGLPVEKY